MRILQIHKFFFPHAGSETVLFNTRALLTSNGHDVVDFAMEHPDNSESPYQSYFAAQRDYIDPSRTVLLRARDAAASVYSLSARTRLRRLIKDTKPDIAHLHIIYHQLTMSVVDELAHAGIPMVMTLHDYKIGCPAYVLYRNGHPCRDCTTGAVYNAVKHRCVKGSRAASTIAGVEAALSRASGKYAKVDVYVCPSAFAAGVAIEAGIPSERTRVLPNFLPDSELRPPVTSLVSPPRFFFAGRLEQVKGVEDLISTFAGADPSMGTLAIAGAGGELEPKVKRAALELSNVEYLGRLTRSEILENLRSTRAAVLPSRWDENNPMSILEARSVGIPVVVTSRGGLPEMVSDGVDGHIVRPGNVSDLRTALEQLAADPARAAAMGRAGYARFRRENSADSHYNGLMAAYGAACGTDIAAPAAL